MSEVRIYSQLPLQTVQSFSNVGASPYGSSNAVATPYTQDGSQVCSGPVLKLMSGGYQTIGNTSQSAQLLGLQAQYASQITGSPASGQETGGTLSFRDGFKSVTTTNAVIKAATRSSSRLGQMSRAFGSGAGLVGSAWALPGGIENARQDIENARQTGDAGDIARAVATTSSTASTGGLLVKSGMRVVESGAGAYGRSVGRRAAEEAFRQAAPNASADVIRAASRQAGRDAMGDVGAKLARRGAASAALDTAKATGTIARGAGVGGRAAAKTILREGGGAAARAAGSAVARTGAKTVARGAGRFVPGVNIAIAALDTAEATATLADPNAGVGKKITSVITAAGSVASATNIPVVSQVGAAVSTVSSFVGAFFK